jgi:hypothetical protein
MYTPNATQAALLGLISCISKLQQLKWRYPLVIHVDHLTKTTMCSTKINYLQSSRIYLNHLLQQFEYTIQVDNDISVSKLTTTQMLRSHHLHPIRFPTLTVSIQHSTGEVNHLRDSLSRERHTTKVGQYLMDKYNWDLAVHIQIDWNLHDDILQQTAHQRIFNLKFIHFWLPVASHGSQNPDSPTCVRWNTISEDQDHWYKCHNAANRINELRQATIKFLQKTNLHVTLQDITLSAMYSNSEPSHPDLLDLCHQQSQIGWTQFLRGRISKLWIKKHNDLTKSNTGKEIMTKVVVHMFLTFHALWKYRNEEIHGRYPSICARHFKTFIAPRVEMLYGKKHLLPAHDHNILDLSLDKRLNQPILTVERWLQTNESYLLQSISRETIGLSTKTHNITSFSK